MSRPEDVGALVEEYRVFLGKTNSEDSFGNALIGEGHWTPEASGLLVRLAKDYGWFVLRNALAISLALGIEDGELGL